MRNLMLAEFFKIKTSENGFKKSKWKYFFIGSVHISEFEPGGMPTDEMFLIFYNELLRWDASRKAIIEPVKFYFERAKIPNEETWQELAMRLISSTFLIESVTITDKQGEIWTIEYFNTDTGAIKIKNIVSGGELTEQSPSPIKNFAVAEITFTNIPKPDNKQIFRKNEN